MPNKKTINKKLEDPVSKVAENMLKNLGMKFDKETIANVTKQTLELVPGILKIAGNIAKDIQMDPNFKQKPKPKRKGSKSKKKKGRR